MILNMIRDFTSTQYYCEYNTDAICIAGARYLHKRALMYKGELSNVNIIIIQPDKNVDNNFL